MIKNLILCTCVLLSLSSFGQTSTDKYRSVSDSTGMIKAFYLSSDTIRINNPALLPPGTAIPLFDDKEKQIAQYVLNKDRTWIFVLAKKE